MALLLFADNATTVLASPITSSATSVTLAAGTGAKFPNPATGQFFIMSFVDAATGLNTEIVQVTTRSTDVCTIVRGQEGTTAQAWLAGDIATNLWTAGSAAAMVQVSQLQQQAGNYAVDAGAANACSITLSPVPTSLAFLTGVPIRVKIAHANTASATLNVNGLGATVIVHQDGTNLGAGELLANAIATVIFNGTFFQLQDLVFQLLGRANIWTAAQALANNVYLNGTDTSGSQHNILTYSSGNVVQMLGGSAGFSINSNNGANNNLLLTDAGLLTTRAGMTAGGSVNATGDVIANAGGGLGRLRAAIGASGLTDTTVATLLGDFGSLKAGNGFQNLPSGIIIQWGSVGVPTNGGVEQTNVTMPKAFTNTFWWAIANWDGTSPPSFGNVAGSPASGNLSQIAITTDVTAVNPSLGVTWLAIGV